MKTSPLLRACGAATGRALRSSVFLCVVGSLALVAVVPAFGQALNGTSLNVNSAGASALTGTLTVSGATTLNSTLNVVGAIDSDSTTLSFGALTAPNVAYSGIIATYNNDSMPGGTNDSYKLLVNRSPASWLWLKNTTTPPSAAVYASVMRLDNTNSLILYNGASEGVKLDPVTKRLTLGGSSGATLTNTSGTLLTTNGAFTATGALTASSGITNTTGSFTSPTALSFTAAGNITLTPSTTGNLILLPPPSTGNVGIKTPSPDKSLHVSFDSPTVPAIKIGSGTDLQGWYTFLGNDTAATTTSYIGNAFNNNASAFQIRMKGTAAANAMMTVLGSGNVGIGTTSPGLKTEIANGGNPYNLYLSGLAPSLYFGSTSGVFPNNAANPATGFISFSTASGNYSQGRGDLNLATQSFGAGNNSAINFLVPANDTGSYMNAVRIARTGNVGIGTTAWSASGARLAVHYNAAADQVMTLRNTNAAGLSSIRLEDNTGGYVGDIGYYNLAGSTGIRIGGNAAVNTYFPSGNVGVGITNPSYALHIQGSSSTTSGIGLRNATASATGGIYVDNNAVLSLGQPGVSQYLNVKMVNGNIGIGTANPNYALSFGPTLGKVLALYESSGSNLYGISTGGNTAGGTDPYRTKLFANGLEALSVTYAGNVGIGTASPTEKLDVNGSLIHDGNYTHNLSHGNFNATILPANRNDASTGEAGLYSWVSEPYETWTGAGIARNMRNSGSGFPRVNTGLSGQMMRFDESTGIWFTTETPGGTRYNPMHLSGNDMIVSGNVGIATATPNASLDLWKSFNAGTDSLRFSFNDGNAYWMGIQSYVVGSGNVGYRFRTNNVNTTVDALAITGNGNVGIGTITPAASLHVVGNVAREVARFQGGADVSNNRNFVSIYTTNPGYWWELSNQDSAGNGSTNGLAFRERSAAGNSIERVYFATGGNVGIGTTSPTHKLSVKGTIRAQEIIVDNTGWADYVFDESYNLAPLSDVEAHIKAKKHLPGIPSAAEIAKHGVSMGDMQSKLLSKIEELTLHMIRIEKENSELRQRVQKLEATTTTP